MKTLFFLLIFLTGPAGGAIAQRTPRDSTARDTTTDGHFRPVIHYVSYNVRAAAGIQRSFYFDIGLSREYFQGSGHGYVGLVLFGSFSMFPALHSEALPVKGVKAGAEFLGGAGIIGLEVSNWWAGGQNDVMITPRYGLGVGLVNLSYSYSFTTNGYPFSQIGRHAVALQFNIPFYKKDKLNKKPEVK